MSCTTLRSVALERELQMKLAIVLHILSTLTGTLLAAQTAVPNDLPGKPFFITRTWTVGGEGSWDALTVDPVAKQLWIAHGRRVQIVDIGTGAVIGNVEGFVEARSIAFDDTGEFAYISDSTARQVKVIDRRTLQSKTSIPIKTSPRWIYFDHLNDLLFVLPAPGAPVNLIPQTVPRPTKSGSGTRNPSSLSPPGPSDSSLITVIDPEKQIAIGQILLSGRVNSAQSDSSGQLYLTVTDRNQILHIDESIITRMLRDNGKDSDTVLDWSDGSRVPHPAGYSPTRFALSPACTEPKGLAVDGKRQRLFVACGNGKLTVWNPAHGELVATLPIATTTAEIVFDSARNLLFAANSNGSLTVVRQYVTDSYTVLQDLPTLQQARTLTLNPATGEVYLVTNQLGFDLTKPGGIGKLQAIPVPGSFQVLVVGN